MATFACPIGVIANFSAIHLIPFLALGTLAVAGAFAGSFICGWTCPFGLLQDLLDRVPAPKFVLPNWVGYLRFLVLLGLVIIVPYWWGEGHALFFCRVCPAGGFGSRGAQHDPQRDEQQRGRLADDHEDRHSGALRGAGFIHLAAMVQRLCPLGVIFSVCNRVSLLVLRFHRGQCVDCVDCRSLCHTGEEARGRVHQIRCIRCLECTRCRAVTVVTAFTRMKG